MSEKVDPPVVLITGSSYGLGWHIANTFHRVGYRVVLCGRNQNHLEDAKRRIDSESSRIVIATGDVGKREHASHAINVAIKSFGRLDVLINCVGTSDRGLVENLDAATVHDLINQNVVTSLLCSQAARPHLQDSGGVIVNIGSLASKVAPRYLGGYAIAKHALAGMTQQMRLELIHSGIHVALVSPGPIRRNDAGSRYDSKIDESVPKSAAKPGGGAKLKGLAPESVAEAVLKCVHFRRPDIVLPRYLRLFIAIGHISPRLGDWLLLKFTSSGSEPS